MGHRGFLEQQRGKDWEGRRGGNNLWRRKLEVAASPVGVGEKKIGGACGDETSK